MLEGLKKEVCAANLELVKRGVVVYTWGNVSAITDDRMHIVIKPSGVPYETMIYSDMVVVDLSTGNVVEGDYQPSTDTDTHLEIYKAFPNINSVVHTHSVNAVAFAQAGQAIPALGTTHADYFYGNIPCTRSLSEQEVKQQYELHTGKVIVETIRNFQYDPMAIPGILVKNHGPFAWGTSASNAVHNAVVMEIIAEMAFKSLLISGDNHKLLEQYILDKHYLRKHGKGAYYGQRKSSN